MIRVLSFIALLFIGYLLITCCIDYYNEYLKK